MSHVMIQSLVTSFRYNRRRRRDFGVSFDNYSCSCCKETSPTQSVMLDARLDTAQATVRHICSALSVFINIHEVTTLSTVRIRLRRSQICFVAVEIVVKVEHVQLGRLCRTWVIFVARMSNVLSTLPPVCTGSKRHGRLCRHSTKSTVSNSTLSPVCTRLYAFNAECE